MNSPEQHDIEPAPPAAYGQHAPFGPSPGVQATMDQMTERLQTVIDAAERAAEAIRYDAEEQARQHLAEAQRKADRMTAERVGLISNLTDDLIRHAGHVREQSEQMVRSLEQAINAVSGKLEIEIEPVTRPPDPPAPGGGEQGAFAMDQAGKEAFESPVAPDGYDDADPQHPAEAQSPHGDVPADPDSAGVDEEALLHATRLAVEGYDREAITRALREDLGVEDPDPILERVQLMRGSLGLDPQPPTEP